MAEEQRLQGCVDWYLPDKGYGVILGNDQKEYFIHHSNLPEGTILEPGKRVSFAARERRRGQGGQEAYNVQVEAVVQKKQPGPQTSQPKPAMSEGSSPKSAMGAKPTTAAVRVASPVIKTTAEKPKPASATLTVTSDQAVENTKRIAEEALRLKLARMQGIAPPPDPLAPGTKVEHALYGRGEVILALPQVISVRFEREPRILRDVPRAEIHPATIPVAAPTPIPPRVAVSMPKASEKTSLRKLIHQWHVEVEEQLTEEGLSGISVYRFEEPQPLPQPSAPLEIDPVIADLYREVEGITTFYSHQSETRRYLLEGKHVVISTPTASGKTEAYNPTILEQLIHNPNTTALYVFPLVALGNDQLDRLQRLNDALPGKFRLELGIYNNAVDQETKNRTLRSSNRILVTTPDSLHYIFLGKPYPSWRTFFRNLRYVVLDEAHVYRGVLGANMANIVRRLLVRCRREGNPDFPQLIISSATIRDPLQLAQQLTGLPKTDFALVDQSGAPTPGRHYLVTRSDIHDLSELCADLLTATTQDIRTGDIRPVRTIVFRRSINDVKQLVKKLREYLEHQQQGDLIPQVEAYYAERVDKNNVLMALQKGHIRCLVTTVALMAGIDIGSLDVAIVDGFPGKVMDARQMFGRAGRAGEGAAIFIARPADPLDQFYFERSENLFRGPTENVVANPENPFILTAHLKCAAQVEEGNYNNREGPLPVQYLYLFGPMGNDIVNAAVRDGEMILTGGVLRLCGPDPHELPPLNNFRSAMTEEYILLDPAGTKLEHKRELTAFRDAHPGARLWCNGEAYRVSTLDFQTHNIVCIPESNTSLRTQGVQRIDVFPSDSPQTRRLKPSDALLQNGPVCITTVVDKYRLYQRDRVMRCRNQRCRYESASLKDKKCPRCGEAMQIRYVECILDTLPIQTKRPLSVALETRATWLTLPAALRERFEAEFWPRWETNGAEHDAVLVSPGFRDALHSALHAILKAFPEIILCDDSEIDGISQPPFAGGGRKPAPVR